MSRRSTGGGVSPEVARIREAYEGKTGVAVLHEPHLNKGTGFSEAERDALGLRGLVPPRSFSMADQKVRILENLRAKTTGLDKYIFLAALQDRNERLFYRTVIDHIEELMPIIYTPTVGEACKRFARIFQRSHGLYVSADDRGRVRDILRNWPRRDVRIIVVTDGERILGLGDLGANGMGIPIGKLALYTACAGISPQACLPIMLDVGTNNVELRDDPLYLGLARERLRGAPYRELVDELVQGVQEIFPKALLQFEDFANPNAIPLLAAYRDRVCCFNDDIQGTAAVALAGLLGTQRISGRRLADETLLFYGAGAAATGIAELCVRAMRRAGLAEPEARRRCWFVDSKGLVTAGRAELEAHKRPFAHPGPSAPDLPAAVQQLKPTALIGVSGDGGAFTRPIIEAMAAHHERPVIFALSNPTANAECSAEDAYTGSGGRCVFASGSPFPPFALGDALLVPGQGNNAYIFPGVGLGVIASGARHVTDEMFLAAADSLASEVSGPMLARSQVYPPLTAIREVSARIAVKVAEEAWRAGLASLERPADLAAAVRALMYDPTYD